MVPKSTMTSTVTRVSTGRLMERLAISTAWFPAPFDASNRRLRAALVVRHAYPQAVPQRVIAPGDDEFPGRDPQQNLDPAVEVLARPYGPLAGDAALDDVGECLAF